MLVVVIKKTYQKVGVSKLLTVNVRFIEITVNLLIGLNSIKIIHTTHAWRCKGSLLILYFIYILQFFEYYIKDLKDPWSSKSVILNLSEMALVFLMLTNC